MVHWNCPTLLLVPLLLLWGKRQLLLLRNLPTRSDATRAYDRCWLAVIRRLQLLLLLLHLWDGC
jgi:hypothetical protein